MIESLRLLLLARADCPCARAARLVALLISGSQEGLLALRAFDFVQTGCLACSLGLPSTSRRSLANAVTAKSAPLCIPSAVDPKTASPGRPRWHELPPEPSPASSSVCASASTSAAIVPGAPQGGLAPPRVGRPGTETHRGGRRPPQRWRGKVAVPAVPAVSVSVSEGPRRPTNRRQMRSHSKCCQVPLVHRPQGRGALRGVRSSQYAAPGACAGGALCGSASAPGYTGGTGVAAVRHPLPRYLAPPHPERRPSRRRPLETLPPIYHAPLGRPPAPPPACPPLGGSARRALSSVASAALALWSASSAAPWRSGIVALSIVPMAWRKPTLRCASQEQRR